MKKLLLLILCFTAIYVKGQTEPETIVYINNILKDAYKANPMDPDPLGQEARKNKAIGSRDAISEPIELEILYENINVNSTGLLTINKYADIYVIPSGTPYPDWLNIEPKKTKTEFVCKYEVYLKSLDTVVKCINNSILFNCNFPNKAENWHCIKYSFNPNFKDAYIFKKEDVYSNSYRLDVNGVEDAKRCRNAIVHLIKLGWNNNEYYTNDPFIDKK